MDITLTGNGPWWINRDTRLTMPECIAGLYQVTDRQARVWEVEISEQVCVHSTDCEQGMPLTTPTQCLCGWGKMEHRLPNPSSYPCTCTALVCVYVCVCVCVCRGKRREEGALTLSSWGLRVWEQWEYTNQEVTPCNNGPSTRHDMCCLQLQWWWGHYWQTQQTCTAGELLTNSADVYSWWSVAGTRRWKGGEW